jgi:16S rRNA (adenine1518-N6/adenine1519-N6)-dimethyltransferase
MRAKKALGQNWLVDGEYARRIVAAVAPAPSDLVVEIGPGPGALTDLVVPRAGHTLAIELDPRMLAPLSGRHSVDRLTLVEADVLGVDLSTLVHDVLAARPWLDRARVLANLPYYISSPVLAHLIAHRRALADATVMLQREVVARITARPGGKEYGSLSVLVAMYCEAKRLFDVPPGAFRPMPKVVSSVLRLVFRETPAVAVPDEARFFAIVRAAFAQRRKTLENSLRAAGLAGLAEDAGLDPRSRAETLSLDEFAALALAEGRRAQGTTG